MLTNAKMVLAAVLLAGSVSTALAYEDFDVDLYHANPNAKTSDSAMTAYAQAYPRRQTSARSNPTAVYEYGHYIGQDPDANVRLMLRKDFGVE